MSWARHLQVVLEPTDVELRHNDLSRLTTSLQRLEFIRLSQQHSAWTADASRTLFRASCFRLGDVEHVIVLFVDPIVSDCQSMDVLVRDFLHFCGDRASRETAGTLLPVRTSFPAFAAWEAEACASGHFDAAMSYWQQQWDAFGESRIVLDDFACALTPSGGAGSEHGSVDLGADEATTRAIRQAAAQNGITLYAFLLAALAIVLTRWTGRSRLAVWSHCSNRKPTTVDVVGWFVHTGPPDRVRSRGECVLQPIPRTDQSRRARGAQAPAARAFVACAWQPPWP